MNSPYITTKELAEILPFSRAHIADRITHPPSYLSISAIKVLV